MKKLFVIGLLLVVVALSACMSPDRLLPERTVFQAPLPNVDNAVVSGSGSTILVPFRNNAGAPITLPLTADASGDCDVPVSVSGKLADGTRILAGETEIMSGEAFTLLFDCNDFSGKRVGDELKTDLSFEYVNVDSAITREQVGSIMAKVLE